MPLFEAPWQQLPSGGFGKGLADMQTLQQMRRASQQFPLEQQQLHQQIADAKQKAQQGAATFPLAQQLTQATIRHLQAQSAQLEKDDTGTPLSAPGKMIQDLYKLPEGSPQRVLMRQMIDGQMAQKRNQMMSPGEKALEQSGAKNFSALIKDAGQKALTSNSILGDLKIFKNDYEKTGYFSKGVFHIPGVSRVLAYGDGTAANYHSADKASARLRLNILKVLHAGRFNQKLIDIVNQSMVGMGTTPGGVEKIVPQLRTEALRSIEFPKFLSALRKSGVTDAATANDLWQRYVNKYPGVDDNGKPMPQNIGKWQEFVPKGKQQTQTTPTQEDLEYTAQKHGMTVAQVKKQLGIQ